MRTTYARLTRRLNFNSNVRLRITRCSFFKLKMKTIILKTIAHIDTTMSIRARTSGGSQREDCE